MSLPAISSFATGRPARALAVAILAGALILPTASVATAVASEPVASGPTTLTDPVTFYGRGYGHGVGMSQYGARGRARAGQDALTILAHYYPGATPTPVGVASRIRVLVLGGWKATAAVPLTIFGRAGSWGIDGVATAFPADAVLRLSPIVVKTSTGTTATWRAWVTASSGAILFDRKPVRGLRVRPRSATTTLQLYSKPSTYDRYRDVLRVMPSATAPRVTVVNELPLEAYLRGAVPAEMPATWPAQALQAQAIAARSYALRRAHPTSGTFDVYDDTRSQVYRGMLAERAASDAAIVATAGVVLKSGTSIANTLYHSTGGGATENNEYAFVSSTGALVAGPVSYLRGSADRAADGSSYDATAPYAAWQTRSYSLAQLSAWFAADGRTAVGTLFAIDLRNRGVSGRLVSVTLIGTTGSKRVSGDVFAAVFNAHRPATEPPIRSNLFNLAPLP